MLLEGLTVFRIVAAAAAGLVLGAVYFWGLWWTSRRVGRTRVPGLLFMGSFVVRMAILLGGLWLVTGGRLVETAVAVIGIFVARRFVINAVQRNAPGESEASAGQ